MTKTIKGFVLIAQKEKCPGYCRPKGDFCAPPIVYESKRDANTDKCDNQHIVTATLTYEVPDDNA